MIENWVADNFFVETIIKLLNVISWLVKKCKEILKAIIMLRLIVI